MVQNQAPGVLPTVSTLASIRVGYASKGSCLISAMLGSLRVHL